MHISPHLSPCFGVLVDGFGIPWEIDTTGGQDAA